MIIRWVEVDHTTGALGAVESMGQLADTYDSLRANIVAAGTAMVALSDSGLLMSDVSEGLTEEQVAALAPPEDAVVRLPHAGRVSYDAAGWFVPKPRVPFEEAQGRTQAELVAERMAEEGEPLNLATATVDALEGEYDAYDPLEGVHPYGTSIEDIAMAAIVAAEARAARRAGDA